MPVSAPAQEPAAKDIGEGQLHELSTGDVVASWQKDKGNKKLTSEVLKRMQPTISAAINSYAPGMERQLSVRAAKLTLGALETFDQSRGVAPSTYVFHNLKRLNRLGARAQNIIPQSEYASAERKAVMSVFDKFVDDRGREPSMEELADRTGISVKRLSRILDQGAVVSESSTLTDDSRKDTQASSTLTDADYYAYVYASVDPVSQKIMEWSSGLKGGRVLSNNQIADRLHISPAAVSQRKTKIQRLLSDARSLV